MKSVKECVLRDLIITWNGIPLSGFYEEPDDSKLITNQQSCIKCGCTDVIIKGSVHAKRYNIELSNGINKVYEGCDISCANCGSTIIIPTQDLKDTNNPEPEIIAIWKKANSIRKSNDT